MTTSRRDQRETWIQQSHASLTMDDKTARVEFAWWRFASTESKAETRFTIRTRFRIPTTLSDFCLTFCAAAFVKGCKFRLLRRSGVVDKPGQVGPLGETCSSPERIRAALKEGYHGRPDISYCTVAKRKLLRMLRRAAKFVWIFKPRREFCRSCRFLHLWFETGKMSPCNVLQTALDSCSGTRVRS